MDRVDKMALKLREKHPESGHCFVESLKSANVVADFSGLEDGWLPHQKVVNFCKKNNLRYIDEWNPSTFKVDRDVEYVVSVDQGEIDKGVHGGHFMVLKGSEFLDKLTVNIVIKIPSMNK